MHFFLVITVLWTALSLALGVEVAGEPVRGLPCITRFNQLFCQTGGTSYPTNKIDRFIDDNKALIRRMHGEFISPEDISEAITRKKRFIHEDGPLHDEELQGSFLLKNGLHPAGESNPYVNVYKRVKRQTRGSFRNRTPGPVPPSAKQRVDVCKSEEEVATPYWASNSQGKILAIVNNKDFSQVIHQEICLQQSTGRCKDDCGCEQKYKYHRLMAYDPENECKGIFMDWFLFPSCCSCRCDEI